MRGNLGVWRALDRARGLNLRSAGDGITRRRVLAAIGAGAALGALPSCFREAPDRVAIVGGGLAGLTALDRLRAKGVDAVLYEARGAIGGRTRSVRGVFAPGYAFDEGGQLVNSDHEDMLRLVRELGLKLIDRRSAGAKDEIQIGRRGRVDEARLTRDLQAIAEQITRDSDRLDKDYDTVAREIDTRSVAQYLDRYGLASGDARDALEAAIRTEYGAEARNASALELLFNLPTIDGERVTRLSLSDERYLIDGGTAQVCERLAARHTPAIRLNKKLAAVDIGAERPRLRFADGEDESFSRVILALPAPLLRELRIDGPLPPEWRAFFAEANLGQNEKVIAGYDRAVWRPAIGMAGALWATDGFSEAWDAASSATPDDAPGALTYFLGGDQVKAAEALATAAAAERFAQTTRKVLPDLEQSNGRLRRTRWCADPLTRGSYINFAPGQLTRFGGLLTLEEEGEVRPSRAGPLILAGEWLSDAWPGYMNGAVQTGRIAADAAMATQAAKQAA